MNFLAAQRVNNWGFQALGQRNQFVVGALAACAAKDGDLARLIQNLSGPAKLMV